MLGCAVRIPKLIFQNWRPNRVSITLLGHFTNIPLSDISFFCDLLDPVDTLFIDLRSSESSDEDTLLETLTLIDVDLTTELLDFGGRRIRLILFGSRVLVGVLSLTLVADTICTLSFSLLVSDWILGLTRVGTRRGVSSIDDEAS